MSQPEYFPRQFDVVKVRDLVENPLTPVEYFRRPLTVRGRWLVTGFDHHLQQFRNFYPANSLEYERDCQLRIGLYEIDGKKPLEVVSRSFENSVAERIMLARTIKKWNTDDLRLHGLRLGVFADDLKILSNAG